MDFNKVNTMMKINKVNTMMRINKALFEELTKPNQGKQKLLTLSTQRREKYNG